MKDENHTAPEFNKEFFYCPHCNVCSQQTWTDLSIENGKGRAPEVFIDISGGELCVENRFASSMCYLCKHYSIWHGKNMIYPDSNTAPSPNADLPEKIIVIYKEAASILSRSPRAAAALLRLAIEDLCVHLEYKGNTLKNKVDCLIEETNATKELIEALYYVRIIGNEAVHSHSGAIYLDDDPERVAVMFKLVNLIANRLITEKRETRELYDSLPEDKKCKNLPAE